MFEGHSKIVRGKLIAPLVMLAVFIGEFLMFYFDYNLAQGNLAAGFLVAGVYCSYAIFPEIMIAAVILIYVHETRDMRTVYIAAASLFLTLITIILLIGRVF